MYNPHSEQVWHYVKQNHLSLYVWLCMSFGSGDPVNMQTFAGCVLNGQQVWRCTYLLVGLESSMFGISCWFEESTATRGTERKRVCFGLFTIALCEKPKRWAMLREQRIQTRVVCVCVRIMVRCDLTVWNCLLVSEVLRLLAFLPVTWPIPVPWCPLHLGSGIAG